MTQVSNQHHQTFEDIRQSTDENHEFWSARDLAKVLQYSEYRHFLPVIAKAKKACEKSGKPTANHFEHVLEMVTIGSGAHRRTENYHLSRYACYLIILADTTAYGQFVWGRSYKHWQAFLLLPRQKEKKNKEFPYFNKKHLWHATDSVNL